MEIHWKATASKVCFLLSDNWKCIALDFTFISIHYFILASPIRHALYIHKLIVPTNNNTSTWWWWRRWHLSEECTSDVHPWIAKQLLKSNHNIHRNEHKFILFYLFLIKKWLLLNNSWYGTFSQFYFLFFSFSFIMVNLQ